VEDLGSTNGTLVNGQAISQQVPLGRGDTIAIGGTVLEVR
jgi:pSer/pThr/pTyr-binding forkhead associated (FHA) protein